ncbi:hypothetical protein NQ318_014376 [Aromia moschata]|uniref:Mos1 transposase HTH domain-containing protein n=1 Tax=Aromia moschata TaxID=1265417 RepID=A0AAV8YZ60_9CUCU|nr:hypothetical protein NQ318_014376 [Aromia moschata]
MNLHLHFTAIENPHWMRELHTQNHEKRCFVLVSCFMMAGLSEQRAAVKFCFLLRKNAAETVLMLKTAYKDDAIGKTQVYEWFDRFKNDDMSIDDDNFDDQLPETTKMLKKFQSLCSQTVDRQLINCQRLVGYLGARFSEF